MDNQTTRFSQSGHDDQIRRLARVFAYRDGAGVQWMDYNPLDDPKWIDLAEDYIDFIITGGNIK